METFFVFLWVWIAAISMSIWETSIEGRNAWDRGKIGWKIKFKDKTIMTKYHFFLLVMFLFLMTLPFVVFEFNFKILGVLISAFSTGAIIEGFFWYVFNPKVKLKEFWGSFSDYFFWIRIKNIKIIPVNYFVAILIALASWYFIWRGA